MTRYRVGDIPDLLRSPIGRLELLGTIRRQSLPLAIHAARWYRRTALQTTQTVVVVGSFAKTTTTRAIAAALGHDPRRHTGANAGLAIPHTILHTPPGRRHLVMEIGIDGPDQMDRCASMVRPDVAVVTCIGSEHQRSFGTLEVTRHEKAHMVRALRASGVAVLNADDPNVMWMSSQTCARIITYGTGPAADIRASDSQLDWPHGMRFTLHVDGQARRIRTRFLGSHMVHPLLAAVAVARAEGQELDRILTALQALGPTPGRLEPIDLDSGAILLRDDIKSTLETIDRALDLLDEIPAPRKTVVMGEVSEPPGSQGPIYRKVGERIGQVASRAIFIGGNYQRYAAGAVRGGLDRSMLQNAGRSPSTAVAMVQTDLKPGEVVLVKGRDTQHLQRVSLALVGKQVRCDIPFCQAKVRNCGGCPMLQRGWEGLRAII